MNSVKVVIRHTDRGWMVECRGRGYFDEHSQHFMYFKGTPLRNKMEVAACFVKRECERYWEDREYVARTTLELQRLADLVECK